MTGSLLPQIGQENPEFLIAHAYTRYLGDLSGGQVLGRIAQKSMGLKSSEGLSFFAFPGVSSPNLFKQLYRSRMNSVELTEEQRTGVLEEAVRAFELNIEVRSSSSVSVKRMEFGFGSDPFLTRIVSPCPAAAGLRRFTEDAECG